MQQEEEEEEGRHIAPLSLFTPSVPSSSTYRECHSAREAKGEVITHRQVHEGPGLEGWQRGWLPSLTRVRIPGPARTCWGRVFIFLLSSRVLCVLCPWCTSVPPLWYSGPGERV